MNKLVVVNARRLILQRTRLNDQESMKVNAAMMIDILTRSVYAYELYIYFTDFYIFFLGASTSNQFSQDPIYPPADLPSTLHRDNWRTIQTRQSRGNQVQDRYNYCLNSLNMGELVGDVKRIFQDQTTIFKLNLSFGFVLFNNEMEQMQYHSSANNNRVLETPFLVRNHEDLLQFVPRWKI